MVIIYWMALSVFFGPSDWLGMMCVSVACLSVPRPLGQCGVFGGPVVGMCGVGIDLFIRGMV